MLLKQGLFAGFPLSCQTSFLCGRSRFAFPFLLISLTRRIITSARHAACMRRFLSVPVGFRERGTADHLVIPTTGANLPRGAASACSFYSGFAFHSTRR